MTGLATETQRKKPGKYRTTAGKTRKTPKNMEHTHTHLFDRCKHLCSARQGCKLELDSTTARWWVSNNIVSTSLDTWKQPDVWWKWVQLSRKQVHRADQALLPAQVDSFVGCSLHCALHPPAARPYCESLFGTEFDTHTPGLYGCETVWEEVVWNDRPGRTIDGECVEWWMRERRVNEFQCTVVSWSYEAQYVASNRIW